MCGCLSSVSYAVLVNGSAKGWVKALKGLRQGDPLSTFLFTFFFYWKRHKDLLIDKNNYKRRMRNPPAKES